MARFLLKQAEARPQEPALTDERGVTSWAHANERVNQLIHGLRAQGLTAGSTMAVFSGNCREYFEIIAAAGHAGIVFVPVNWHFTGEELAYVADNAGAQLLIIEAPYEAVAEDAQRTHGLQVPTFVIRGGGANDYETLLAAQPASEPDAQSLGGPMFYTSGTTGRPKGVRSSTMGAVTPLEVMEMMGAGMSDMLAIPTDGRTLLCGPVYHSAQWAFSYLPFVNGTAVVSRHKFDALETLKLIDEHRITNVHLVPTQFHRMLQLPDADRQAFDGGSLQAVWHGAAPCPPKVKEAMIHWWGNVVNEYYGSTEGSIVTTIDAQAWLEKQGSVGKPTPLVELTVRADDGTVLPDWGSRADLRQKPHGFGLRISQRTGKNRFGAPGTRRLYLR